jgi:hypothetical protein
VALQVEPVMAGGERRHGIAVDPTPQGAGRPTRHRGAGETRHGELAADSVDHHAGEPPSDVAGVEVTYARATECDLDDCVPPRHGGAAVNSETGDMGLYLVRNKSRRNASWMRDLAHHHAQLLMLQAAATGSPQGTQSGCPS